MAADSGAGSISDELRDAVVDTWNKKCSLTDLVFLSATASASRECGAKPTTDTPAQSGAEARALHEKQLREATRKHKLQLREAVAKK